MYFVFTNFYRMFPYNNFFDVCVWMAWHDHRIRIELTGRNRNYSIYQIRSHFDLSLFHFLLLLQFPIVVQSLCTGTVYTAIIISILNNHYKNNEKLIVHTKSKSDQRLFAEEKKNWMKFMRKMEWNEMTGKLIRNSRNCTKQMTAWMVMPYAWLRPIDTNGEQK